MSYLSCMSSHLLRRLRRSPLNRVAWVSLCLISATLALTACDDEPSNTQSHLAGQQEEPNGGRLTGGVVGGEEPVLMGPTCTDEPSTGQVVGLSCECGGVWACESGRFVCEGGSPLNACGGCAPLEGAPGEACGACGDGALTCAGQERLSCVGEGELNACGGCLELAVSIGARCGEGCGVWACQEENLARCEEQPRNSCGGCGVNNATPGDACGVCGVWRCDEQGELSCDDPGEETCNTTRLLLMGDTGEASEMQYRVSAAAQARCDALGGCAGFVMLGDNIYDTGAESVMDQQLTDKIDLPYANLKLGPPPPAGQNDTRERMPIYVSLGNHDLGGAGLNSAQVQHYLGYASAHEWFYYPDEFWELQLGPVHLISLHTNPLAYGIPDNLFEPQAELVSQARGRTSAAWTLAFGHHPYRSNGRHGNAGAYEGIPLDIDVMGGAFRRWVDEELCNKVDFYVSGHDHNRQWIDQVPLTPNLPEGSGTTPCNTTFAVSGAGAKLTDLEGRGNVSAFEDDTKEGFLIMEFHRDRVYVEFCDYDGQVDWSRTISR